MRLAVRCSRLAARVVRVVGAARRDACHRARWQAGVSLGLAEEIEANFPFGPQLATALTAAIVLNQLIGPPLLKLAIRRSARSTQHMRVPQNSGPNREAALESRAAHAHVSM